MVAPPPAQLSRERAANLRPGPKGPMDIGAELVIWAMSWGEPNSELKAQKGNTFISEEWCWAQSSDSGFCFGLY